MFDKQEIIVDNFAGGGGASTGIELATGRPVTIAINHDIDAIAMHKINHPFTKHYCESVWDVKPREICEGHPVGLMWLSPDCKHFSRAKGGTPVDKNIRGLAWIAARWAATVKPRIIILENVPEFVTWGPLRNGKPIKEKRGVTFNHFITTLKLHGYDVAWKVLKACDYGAPTLRQRLFLIARCDGKPIVFPKPTHSSPDSADVQNQILQPYKTASSCIDWSLPCKSIFNRKKPLADNTMRRIIKGLDKFVIHNPHPFIKNHCTESFLIQYHSETSQTEVRGQSVDRPIMTIDAHPRYALTTAYIQKYYGGGYTGSGSDINSPMHTVTAIDHNALVETSLFALNKNQYLKDAENSKIRTYTITHTGKELGNWEHIRAMLNKYCNYSISDNEVLIIEIDGVPYFINDIGMRMLVPRELYKAQGFPDDYIIDVDCTGKAYPKAKQVARCGNAVPPPFASALVRANLPEWCRKDINTMRDFIKEVSV